MKQAAAGQNYNLRTAEDNGTGYRFGFNGKEQDFTMHDADGEVYNFEARMYDARADKFLSLDQKYISPSASSYEYAGNSPILYIDKNGEYKLSAELQKKYPVFSKYLETGLKDYVEGSANVMGNLLYFSNNPSFGQKELMQTISWNNGPTLVIKDDPGGVKAASGKYIPEGQGGGADGTIEINSAIISAIENKLAGLEGQLTEDERQGALLLAISTLLHETVHRGEYYRPGTYDDPKAEQENVSTNDNAPKGWEAGWEFQKAVWGTNYTGAPNVGWDLPPDVMKGIQNANDVILQKMVKDEMEDVPVLPK